MSVQMELFPSPIPSRPQISDDIVFQMMIDRMMPRVMRWMDQPDLPGSEFYEDVKRDLVSCLKDRGRQLDAWDAVMYLKDTCHWDMDRDALDIFDDVHIEMNMCFGELVVNWAHQYNVKCRFKRYDSVYVKSLDKVVIISELLPNAAQYITKCELIVNDEDVRAL
jgi:hypothetical protein